MNRRMLLLAGLGLVATSAIADMNFTAMRLIVANAAVGATQGLTKCPKCGKKVEKTWRFCDKCGAKLTAAKPPTTTGGTGGTGGSATTGGTGGASGAGGTSANVHSGHAVVANKGLKVFTVTNLPVGLTSGAQIARGLAIGPMGGLIAYGSNAGATTDVYAVDASKPLNTPKLISSDTSSAEFDPDFHPDGRHIAYISESTKSGSFLMIETIPRGPIQTFRLEQGVIWQPRFSPSGNHVAYVRKDGDRGPGDIYVFDLKTQVSTQLTSGPGNDDSPTWCPKGCHIAFESDRSGSQQVWSATVGSSAAPRQISKVGPHRRPSWSKRGYIVYESNFTIYAMNENGGDEQMVSTLPLAGTMARVSADGSAIVFQRRQSLGNEAFIIRLK